MRLIALAESFVTMGVATMGKEYRPGHLIKGSLATQVFSAYEDPKDG